MGGTRKENRCTAGGPGPLLGGALHTAWSQLMPPTAPPTAPRVYRLHERLVAIRTEYNLRLKSGVAAPVTQVTVQTTQRRPELEDATLRYLQDLLAWVEENQRRVDSAEWGGDLPSVEAQLGSHRGLHQSIDEFRAKIERARADEVRGHPGVGSGRGGPDPGHCELHTFHPLQGQLSPAPRGTYRDCLGRLDLQYAKLLVSGGQGAGDMGGWAGGVGGRARGCGLLTELLPACRTPLRPVCGPWRACTALWRLPPRS